MHDFLLHLALAVVSFLVGASLTRVWERARPFLLLEGFGELLSDEQVDCPDDLVQLCTESWRTPELQKGKNPLSLIRSVYDSAQYCAIYEDSLDRLPSLTQQLQSAQKADII
ncbi:MAG: hypothetical protein WB919_08880, partial [Candidatus Sulfotelmatobacter sp.]